MRLNNSDREAFVRAVMDDVPQVDYNEQAARIARAAIQATIPEDMSRVIKKYPDWFSTPTIRMPSPLANIAVTGKFTYSELERAGHEETAGELKKIADKAQAQQAARSELRSKIFSTISGCSTLKQALERLPEFEKYLPKERDSTGVTGLPVVANLVADLTKAGWPKGKKNAT